VVKTFKRFKLKTGATISIEEIDGKGHVEIMTNDGPAMAAALETIKNIITEPEVGETYTGKVKNIMDFGAFVEILPGKEGLLHISEISYERVEKMDGVFEEGQELTVKLLEVDKRSGKLRLSLKALMEKPEGWVEPERKPRPDRGGDRRGGDRRGNDRRDNRR